MPEAQAAGAHAREYETIYVLRPDIARDGQEKIAQRMTEAVAREGGKLTSIENWGRRQLAYEVKKCRRGVYVYVKYVGGGAAVSEVERNLRMLDDVLKYQTVKVQDDIDARAVAVDEESLKFEAVDPPGEDEVDDSIERQLGFLDNHERAPRDHDGSPEDFDDDDVPALNDTEDAQ